MKKAILISVLAAFMLLFTACLGGAGGDNPALSPEGEGQETNAGSQNEGENDGEENTGEPGSPPTLAELSKARGKIESYSYTVEIEDDLSEETITMNVWFLENKMKITISQAEMGNSISYYDLDKGEYISYTEGEDNRALKMSFTPGSDNAPDNPLETDIRLDFEIAAREEVEGYNCTVLQNPAGDMKLWLMDRYGFPVKMLTINTATGEEYYTNYKNIAFNRVTQEDVSPPGGLEIIDFSQ